MRIAPIFVSFVFATALHADDASPALPVNPAPAAYSIDDLVRMSECQLLDLYRQAEPGPIPCGYTPGKMISKPGSKTTVLKSRLVGCSLWQGKNFDDNGIMTNRMFGARFIKGEVGMGESWIDGRPSIIIDYSQTSRIFRPYRDEIREVCPGIYLGVMFKRDCCCPTIVTFFALDARCGSCQSCGK
jgi:hypothetical protein